MGSSLDLLVALLVAVGVDLLFGEPPAALHPVVWMGKVVGSFERRAPKATPVPCSGNHEAGPICYPERSEGSVPLSTDGCRTARARLGYGAGMVAVCIALFAVPAWLLGRWLRCWGLAGAVLLGLCLKPAFAIGALLRAAGRVGAALEQDDLGAAREGLLSLVSRETAALDAPLLAAAAIESVAENLADSVVAPLLYWTLWGLPGAYAYRAINTLDAMVGYRTPQYEHLGKAAARLDDIANLVPARLTALLLVAASPCTGGSLSDAWRAMWRDHAATASPNAGWSMSAAAGALGIQLEKVGHYRLNAGGRLPAATDVARSVALVRAALVLGVPFLAAALMWRGRRVRNAERARSDGDAG